MANLTITEANIKPNDEYVRLQPATFGETVTKGQPVYRSTTDDKWYKADADVLATAKARGIAIVGGVANETGVIQTDGKLQMGAILTVGTQYVVSVTAGSICPRADLASGDFITYLGTASTTSVLDMDVEATGIAVT